MDAIGHGWLKDPLGTVISRHLIKWWQGLDRPDPWSAETDCRARRRDAVPVCHHCFKPLEVPWWFCPDCGCAVGAYNNMMPYVRIFSTGEVVRSGVGKEAHFTRLTVSGYIVVGLTQYWVFAPFYLFRLIRNYLRKEGKRNDDGMTLDANGPARR